MTPGELLYRATARMSLACDMLQGMLARSARSRRDATAAAPFDKTGLLVARAQPIPVWWQDEDLLFAKYPSLAHSLWRAQEFSLIRSHTKYLHPPVLDFGCGDGSFASVLFKALDYGVDNDPEALAIARQYGIYRKLVESSDSSIPVETASVGAIVSNSVLEHVRDLEGVLSEFARILVPGGNVVFTAPVAQFADDLAKYFGRKESRRINAQSAHRHLLSTGEWRGLLGRHGFAVEIARPYQPDWFTYWYRMLRLVGRKGLGALVPSLDEKIWRVFSSRLIGMVRASIASSEAGGNIFIVCSRR